MLNKALQISLGFPILCVLLSLLLLLSPRSHCPSSSRIQVAFGDAIDMTNVSLVLRSCAVDGTLLHPSRPLVALDDMLLHRALGSGQADGEVWYASSDVPHASDSATWFHVLAMNLNK